MGRWYCGREEDEDEGSARGGTGRPLACEACPAGVVPRCGRVGVDEREALDLVEGTGPAAEGKRQSMDHSVQR